MKRLTARAFILIALLQSSACRSTSVPSERPSSSATASALDAAPSAASAVPAVLGDRLPEDAAAAEKSSAQWREHLAEEEHERRLGYDRRKLTQHRALLALLCATQARYERAQSERDVSAVRTRVRALATETQRRVEAIDHWGVNSNLLTDYSAMLAVLGEPYAQAKIAALGGESHPLEASRAEFDAHRRKVEAWLSEAARSDDE